jgi:hypothetical protein
MQCQAVLCCVDSHQADILQAWCAGACLLRCKPAGCALMRLSPNQAGPDANCRVVLRPFVALLQVVALPVCQHTCYINNGWLSTSCDMLCTVAVLQVVALAIGCVLVVKGQLSAEQLTNFLFYGTCAPLFQCSRHAHALVQTLITVAVHLFALLPCICLPSYCAFVRPVAVHLFALCAAMSTTSTPSATP